VFERLAVLVQQLREVLGQLGRGERGKLELENPRRQRLDFDFAVDGKLPASRRPLCGHRYGS
jgi:hypothetical protein